MKQAGWLTTTRHCQQPGSLSCSPITKQPAEDLSGTVVAVAESTTEPFTYSFRLPVELVLWHHVITYALAVSRVQQTQRGSVRVGIMIQQAIGTDHVTPMWCQSAFLMDLGDASVTAFPSLRVTVNCRAHPPRVIQTQAQHSGTGSHAGTLTTYAFW